MVQFSGAEVMPVSAVPCSGRAEVLLVSASPCLCVLYAKLFALLGIVWVRARKSSPRKPKTGEKTLLLGVLGEFFRGSAAGGAVLGEFLSRDPVLRPGLVGGAAHEAGCGGGFALHEAFRGCATGVSEPHVVQFPPFGGGKAATHSGVVPKVQTASSK